MSGDSRRFYLPTVAGRIRRGADKALSFLRRGVAVIPSHLVTSATYMALAYVLMWLELTQPPTVRFGLRALELIPWQLVVFVFIVCGWVLAQKRDVRVYVACHVPIGLYALLVAYGTLTGGIGSLGWLAFIYLVFGTIQGMQNTINEFERLALEREMIAIREKHTLLEERWTNKHKSLSTDS